MSRLARTEVAMKIAAEDKQIVWGEVYVPGSLDTDREFMTAETIETMAYDFMRSGKLGRIDVNHDNHLVAGASVVESFIARPGDPDFIEGAWVVGVHVPDPIVWNQIKTGELNGFSLEALVMGEWTEMEMEIPPVVTGKTMPSTKDGDDHFHTFYVTYDPEGNLVGGRTDEVDGHWHEIKTGTITEEVDGHKHRFSFIEGLK